MLINISFVESPLVYKFMCSLYDFCIFDEIELFLDY